MLEEVQRQLRDARVLPQVRAGIAGERDAAWDLWSEDCVGYPPADWPEPGRSAQVERGAVEGPEAQ